MKRPKTANADIRAAAKKANVYLYEIAKHCGYSECHFCRLLREELDPEQKQCIYDIIRDITSSR